MRCAFLFLAAVPALVGAPAWSATFLSVDQAKAEMFPGQALSPDDRTLTADQAAAIRKASGVNVLTRQVRSFRTATGGRMFVDEVVGKHEFITLALALDPTGAVSGLDILEYRESYGGQVRDPAWRAQFIGKRDGAPLVLDKDVRNNSGGTLSARHVADGVRRLLATNRIAFAGG